MMKDILHGIIDLVARSPVGNHVEHGADGPCVVIRCEPIFKLLKYKTVEWSFRNRYREPARDASVDD
jgi:hypothetical protein